ncbi:MAG TPA: PHP domain-containing protein [Chloroflexota bacterium]|nr:PHP domain-containing protein [Chloroflexota bacterium]
MSILTDYHTHPKRTPDDLPAERHREHFLESMRSYAKRAADLGIDELGFTEHIYRLSIAPGAVPWKAEGGVRGEVGGYVAAAVEVREICAGLREQKQVAPVIRVGMEVDIVPSTVSILQAALPLFPFDYILGSVHRVPDLAESATPEEAYRGYYDTVRWASASGLFHSIAHPDRVHRKAASVSTSFLEEEMTETVSTLAKHGVSVEVSSSGLRGGFSGIDPHATFLELCFRHGVTITLGSDAHKLEAIGDGIPQVRDIAWQTGYREVATYERGRKVMRPLRQPGD